MVGNSQERFEQVFNTGKKVGYFYYERLVSELLPQFRHIPYGAGAGKVRSDQTLINFQSFDCVTFVETFWAINRTLYQYYAAKVDRRRNPFEVFAENLNRIRYFGGENCGIEYRIHYFTQQMEELGRSGLVFNVAAANGQPFNKKIDYISSHVDDYGDFAGTTKQKNLEKLYNQTSKFYYPLKERRMYYPLAKDGDILAFATNEPGLDVSHTAIVSVEDGNVRITHASSKVGRVVMNQDIEEYLNTRTTITGLFIYRPIFD